MFGLSVLYAGELVLDFLVNEEAEDAVLVGERNDSAFALPADSDFDVGILRSSKL